MSRSFLTVLALAVAELCFASDPPLDISMLSGSAIRIDGSLSDWQNAIGAPTLTPVQFYGDESDGHSEGPYDLQLDVWVAVVQPNQVFFAFERLDNLFSSDSYPQRGSSRVWRDGQVEFLVDASRSGQAYAEDVGVQRVVVMPFTEDVPAYAGAAAEVADAESIDWVVVTDTLSDGWLRTRAEGRFAVFNGQGGQANLAVGDTVGFAIVAADVDTAGVNVQHQVIIWPGGPVAVELQQDAEGLGRAVIKPRTATSVVPAGWGATKRAGR